MNLNLDNAENLLDIENKILDLVKEHYLISKEISKNNKKIHYAGRVYDEKELVAAVKNLLKFTLTYGTDGVNFEKKLANYLGALKSYVVNSGSSANLVAISSLKLNSGDQVIVPAMSFPTTVAPIVQNGLIPVFIDTQLGFYNPDIESFKKAYNPKVKAIVFAHTLGNPAQIDLIKEFCTEKNLYLIEDCCDALGSKYDNKNLGSFGDLSTFSFYPAHHITMGEGGAVCINNPKFLRVVDSLRSWGKDCWCQPGELHENGACKKRFSMQFGDLPFGYDHKYVYTNIGYNLKPLDLQCSIAIEQLNKFPEFIEKRKNNFKFLYNLFSNYKEFFILPESLPKAEPCWFAFPLTVKNNNNFSRLDFTQHLENNNIETRVLFAGNIVRQPAYKNIKCVINSDLINSDIVMNNSFFIGVYPGINQENLNKISQVVDSFFVQKYKNKFLESFKHE